MKFLIVLAYLFGLALLVSKSYIWIGGMKKTSTMSMTAFNKIGRHKKVKLKKDDAAFVNSIYFTLFTILGFFIWAYCGVTIGQIALMTSNHFILKWIVYIAMYFVFLNYPLHVLSDKIMKEYEVKKLPEEVLFRVIIIFFYITSIFFYEDIPKMFTWFLVYLN